VGSCSLHPALRRTTTYSIDLNDRSRHGPKSLKERPIRGFLRKLAFSAPAAVRDRLFRLRLPGPGFVRWCPALPGCSGHGVLAPGNPADATAVRARRLPGRTSHPGPTPLNRLFSCSLRTGRAPGGQRSTPGTAAPSCPGTVTPGGFGGRLADYGEQKSVTVPSSSPSSSKFFWFFQPGRREVLQTRKDLGPGSVFLYLTRTLYG
jgi:hypothetical protein